MVDDATKLKETLRAAERKYEEITSLLSNDENSFVLLLVRAYRRGHDPAKAFAGFDQLRTALQEAENLYRAAIAQPEPRALKSRVVLE